MSDSVDDLPIPFGYKSLWIAIRSNDTASFAEALGLKNAQPCPWLEGINQAYDFRGIFVTPPVSDWMFAVGNHPEMGHEQFLPFLNQLSQRFHQVYYFGTHRIVDYQAWAIAEQGQVRRAFGWVGETGEFLLNLGERMADEIELGTGLPEVENAPDEEVVLELARRWTLDPRELQDYPEARGPGRFGTR